MEILAPPPTDPLVRKEPPSDWYRTPSEAQRRVETPEHDPLTLDPDIALWPVTPLSRWPFAGPPTEGVWPPGWMGVDNTGTIYVCTAGGSPGTWVAQGGSSGQTPTITGDIGMFPVAGPYVLAGGSDMTFSIPFDPASTAGGGAFSISRTIPDAIYAAGEIGNCHGGPFDMSVPSTADQWDLQAIAIISDAAGANFISLQAGASIAQGSTSNDIASADYSVVNSSGVDLSYDSSTGAISSAAGGSYGMFFALSGSWD